MRTESKNRISSAWFLFSTLFSPTQSGQNGSSLYPDSLFLQTNGELIQILGTPRHSRVLPPARPKRIWKKYQHLSVSNSQSVGRQFAFSPERLEPKYRRPPSPSNGSHHGDTLDPQTRPRLHPFCQNALIPLVNVAFILSSALQLLAVTAYT